MPCKKAALQTCLKVFWWSEGWEGEQSTGSPKLSNFHSLPNLWCMLCPRKGSPPLASWFRTMRLQQALSSPTHLVSKRVPGMEYHPGVGGLVANDHHPGVEAGGGGGKAGIGAESLHHGHLGCTPWSKSCQSAPGSNILWRKVHCRAHFPALDGSRGGHKLKHKGEKWAIGQVK